MKHIVTKYTYLDPTDTDKITKMAESGNWIMMRKYNGRQALWDGGKTRGTLLRDIPFACPTDDRYKISTGLWSIGRDGFPHVVHAPNFWINNMPEGIPLCGELWLWNDNLFGCSSIVSKGIDRQSWERQEWEKIRYIPFNIKPYHLWPIKSDKYFKDEPYSKTYHVLLELWNSSEHKYIKYPMYGNLKSLGDWDFAYSEAIKENWEGIVLIDMSKPYTIGLTNNILKWRREFDVEAKIIGYSSGAEGKRNDGLIGALLVETTWPENVDSMIGGKSSYAGKKVVYKVSGGLNDEDRIGSSRIAKDNIINIKFNSITNHGKPSLGRIDWEATGQSHREEIINA